MMKKALLTDDECWLRVQARDASADGRFVFAVRTTGVFCRPSCRSKRALRKNVRFFANAQQALDAGFRPCKRCQPDNARAQQRRLDKIACACRLLEQETPVTLASLAQA
ncbi:bifunctional transcriptional activator/DNA repair enzyme protein Ada, partial [Salmonella enterica subsp. enterica serovar Tennessee]|nr:bifunctional transcriptional activator/DNA repair enzyme protein Ada [Salmonella enterica subsp. enterica serovar Tennessee]EDH8143195.1 bifunctional transcriptional activator/DNA repair enzyme protein Ada [Salmonella enterica subsp. enterica serovar Larochelle]